VQSDCLAGARDFAASRAVAEEAAALAEKLGEWARASSMYVSMGHIERVSDRLDEAAAMFGKACEMYERGGEFLMSGATYVARSERSGPTLTPTLTPRFRYLKAASFLQKPQAMDLPTARKNTIVEMLKKSLAAFKKAPKSANRSKGQFDANRALGFCYQSYFDYATNDELDVDAALAAFKDASTRPTAPPHPKSLPQLTNSCAPTQGTPSRRAGMACPQRAGRASAWSSATAAPRGGRRGT
jgi:hypothetical protein